MNVCLEDKLLTRWLPLQRFRKLAKKWQVDLFDMSEYEITRSLVPWKRTQSTSYLVVGSQRVKQEKDFVIQFANCYIYKFFAFRAI